MRRRGVLAEREAHRQVPASPGLAGPSVAGRPPAGPLTGTQSGGGRKQGVAEGAERAPGPGLGASVTSRWRLRRYPSNKPQTQDRDAPVSRRYSGWLVSGNSPDEIISEGKYQTRSHYPWVPVAWWKVATSGVFRSAASLDVANLEQDEDGQLDVQKGNFRGANRPHGCLVGNTRPPESIALRRGEVCAGEGRP